MPVEDVHLVRSDKVDVPFHGILRKEMATNIEMHTSPAEPRFVLNSDAWDDPRGRNDRLLTLNLRRAQLVERLNSIEHSCSRRALNEY